MTASSPTKGCEACNKSGLSLLLLRPSPIAKDARLAPVGSAAVVDASAVVSGLVPLERPVESRYVLRLLRAGYVHVYIPSPPPGVRAWQVFRVTDAADLIAQDNPVFGQQPQPPACKRAGHNVAGMKLLPIPQAHKITTLWIAYSANLWTDTIKARNAANPKAMQKVNLLACGPHDFKPTEAALRSQVLECAVSSLQVASPVPGAAARVDIPQFAFIGMAGQVKDLAETMARAAACHPKTTGHEMAVVLSDPVGAAAELNALRLRRNQWIEAERAKPENAHPINSDAAVAGLKRVFLDSHALNSYDKVSPLCSKSKFDSQPWPAGTEWVPLSSDDRMHLEQLALGDNFVTYLLMAPIRTVLERPDLGRAIYPDHEERAAAWAAKQTEQSWAALAPHIDEAARAKWKAEFAARMKSLHHDPLLRFEQDWLDATEATQTLGYFVTHFDPQDPNKPGAMCSAGDAYASESALVHQPAPFSPQLQERFLKPLDEPVIGDKAVALRALVGNQESLLALIHTQLTGDPGDTGMRDKTYDFLKGALGLDAGEAALKKFSWLGFGVAGFATGYLSAASGALMNVVMTQTAGRGLSPELQQRLLKLQSLWGVQRTMEMAAAGALHGKAPPMPVLLHLEVSATRALEVLRARSGQVTGGSRRYIKRQRSSGAKVRLSLLTDTDTLKAVRGDLVAVTGDPATGSMTMGKAAKTTVAGLGTLALTEEQFLRLYARESSLGTKAVSAVRESLHSGAALQAKTVAISLPGRLALGSVLVQGLGLINGLYALKKAGTEKEVRDAWYGIYDSTAGTLGGLLEVWAVVREASTMAVAGAAVQAGQQAVAKSLSIGALKVLGNLAGAAGGLVNAAGAWAKSGDAERDGDLRTADMYFTSGWAFVGTTATGVALSAGAVADTLVARGIGGAIVEGIALRVGAGGVLATVGGTALTVSGVGLVLLGAGVALQIGAVAITPTPMQRWLGRSYFGKDPSVLSWGGRRGDMFAKGDWAAEFKALQESLAEGGKEPAPEGGKPSLSEKANQAVSP
jgi:hypothetical protein